jgi:hypothetical protein
MKKTVLIAAIAVLLLALYGCKERYTAWEKDKTVNSIEFSKVRFGLIETDTVTIIGFLKQPTVINGYPCSADWLHMEKDGKLLLFKLAEAKEIHQVAFPKDTWVQFNDGNLVVVFPADTVIQGFFCRGGGGVKGVQTAFYKNGNLKSFYSNKNLVIDGVNCISNPMNPIGLHDDGSLRYCTLAEPLEHDTGEYKKGTRIEIDEEGHISELQKK